MRGYKMRSTNVKRMERKSLSLWGMFHDQNK